MRVIPTVDLLFRALLLPGLLPAAMSAIAEARDLPPPSGAPAVTSAATQSTDIGQIAVTIDRAKVIRLPEGARTVIVGNPSIADVAIQKNGIVVVTGKSYGITNMIALDGAGAMLAESTLTVRGTSDTVVVLQRGPLDRQSYSCTPACLPSALLGDASAFYGDNKAQIEQRIQSATPH